MNIISKIVFFVTCMFSVFINVNAQNMTDKSGFYEKLDDGKYRFFYDKQYYLNNSDCQFTYIYRETNFHFQTQVFDGPFVDYDVFNRIVMKGNYSNGIRNGEFEAFHSTGNTKWKVNFENDQPTGTWNYFYPDGKPMMVLAFDSTGVLIKDYYDLEGVHRVKDFNGRYTMNIEVDKYNDFGTTFIQKSGRIKNGKPDGIWNVYIIDDMGNREFLEVDRYNQGRLFDLSNMDYYLEGEEIFGLARTSILPLDWFYRAEAFTYKSCTIDEQSGFVDFLKRYIDNNLALRYANNLKESEYSFILDVDQFGAVKNVEPNSNLTNIELLPYLTTLLDNLNFWIPSYFEGEYIADKIQLQFIVKPDHEYSSIETFDFVIKREKGF